MMQLHCSLLCIVPPKTKVDVISSSEIHVTWTIPTTGDDIISYYTLYIDGSDNGIDTSGPVLQFMLSGLEIEDGRVEVEVQGVNDAGRGPRSDTAIGEFLDM